MEWMIYGANGYTGELAARIVAGLVVGKIVGITFASWGAIRLGVAQLPEGVSWGALIGGACLAGIGFTMVGRHADFRADDTVTIEPTADGCRVRYDAGLVLLGEDPPLSEDQLERLFSSIVAVPT